jgi:signal transduction histidine kinase
VIINNLISNSIKYRDANKDHNIIDIQAVVTDTHVQIIFRDNGIGIAKDLMPRIFDMFFRATERSEGAGLGLYIVKETIDKLHGSIEVDSTINKGTTFRMRIPNMKIPAALSAEHTVG